MIGSTNARGAVDDVERRVEAMLRGLPRGDLDRILVGDPPGVDAVHVNAVGMVVGRRVRVIMFSAALAMFVCGWRVVLNFR